MKKVIIIFVILATLAGAGFFIYSNYKGKGSWKIKAPQAVVDNQGNKENEEDIIVDSNNNAEVVGQEGQDTSNTINTENKAETKEDSSSSSAGIINKLVSWGYRAASSRIIDTIIIHSSYNALGGDEYSVDGLLKEYKSYGVAPHYLIDRGGKIYQLVADKNIAYHAGVGQTPDGRTDINNFSIGIEMMNTEGGKFTSQQYVALKNLIANLKSKYKIKYVLGHNQIAQGRKTDPWNFDWNKI
jgi:N-acetyl-anhydromuramyl-L-alanine amidase AmpD